MAVAFINQFYSLFRDCIELEMHSTRLALCLLLLIGLFPGQLPAQQNDPPPCAIRPAAQDLARDAQSIWQGLAHVPRNAIRRENLAWELPIAAAAGVMIAKVDRPAADRIQSKSLQDTSGLWSNIGLGMELGAGALAWSGGCMTHRSRLAETGFTALTALGAAGVFDLGLKVGFNRQFPFSRHSTGEFWEGGRSFPSGHSSTSFAFAAAVAHSYPHNHWVKWGAYALASGVALSRYPAKKHFPSDILVGATLGYVTGTYVEEHSPLH